MKTVVGFALLLVGIGLGVAIGVRCGNRCGKAGAPVAPAVAAPAPAAPKAVAPDAGQPPAIVDPQALESGQAYLIHKREMDSKQTDLSESVVRAQQALEQLLENYDQRAAAPGGGDDRSVAMGKALTHARLARLALSEGDPETYERHLAIALELSGESSAERLFQQVDQLDRVQQQQLERP